MAKGLKKDFNIRMVAKAYLCIVCGLSLSFGYVYGLTCYTLFTRYSDTDCKSHPLNASTPTQECTGDEVCFVESYYRRSDNNTSWSKSLHLSFTLRRCANKILCLRSSNYELGKCVSSGNPIELSCTECCTTSKCNDKNISWEDKVSSADKNCAVFFVIIVALLAKFLP